MEWYMYLFVILAGVLTGFINTLAGSGSAVSLTMLGILGLPADVANGTNRIAILLQNIIGVKTFHKKKQLDIKKNIPLALTAIPGGVLGAFFAGSLNKDDFRFALGIVMLIILVTLFIKPKKWLEKKEEAEDSDHKFGLKQFCVFFVIGCYGGFVQVGVGVFLLLALVLSSGHALVKSNAIKLLFVLFLTCPALIIFAYKGLVDWKIGLVLALGNMLGAWFAANEAVKYGAKFVRYILICVVLFAAMKYLGILALILKAVNWG